MRTPQLLDSSDERYLTSVYFATEAPRAKQVVLTGDFTGWDREGIPLIRHRSGPWGASFELLPGAYEYRLLIDGEWADHPESRERVPNSCGTENCILRVEE